MAAASSASALSLTCFVSITMAFASATVMASKLPVGSSSLASFSLVPVSSSIFSLTGKRISTSPECFCSLAITLASGYLPLTAGSSFVGLILSRVSSPGEGVVMAFASATILASPAVGASS